MTRSGTRVWTAEGAGLRAAQVTLLARVAGGDQVTLAAAAVVGAGQRSCAGSAAGEPSAAMTRDRTHLMFSKTRRGDGDPAGGTGQGFPLKGRLRGLFPGSGQLLLLELHQDAVVAGLGAVVLTAL